ncbi:MAG: hypothetical protein CVU64_03670 [Deltaproteobacteria bacterium HGW-Deltaproteobacteria-21]|nr:MAG: hypothetical protein CVU64_03670 [Deltaproteobacteria bacterium HGW-Deltaproteobacteria-21]
MVSVRFLGHRSEDSVEKFQIGLRMAPPKGQLTDKVPDRDGPRTATLRGIGVKDALYFVENNPLRLRPVGDDPWSQSSYQIKKPFGFLRRVERLH